MDEGGWVAGWKSRAVKACKRRGKNEISPGLKLPVHKIKARDVTQKRGRKKENARGYQFWRWMVRPPWVPINPDRARTCKRMNACMLITRRKTERRSFSDGKS